MKKRLCCGAVLFAAALYGAELKFSGVLGQSQPEGTVPASAIGSSNAVNARDGKIYFFQGLELCSLEPDNTLKKHFRFYTPADSMLFDGKELYLYLFDKIMYRYDVKTKKTVRLFRTKEFHRSFAVAPAGDAKGFAAKGKFFAIENGKKVIAWDADGQPKGTVLELPGGLKQNARYQSIGLLPETGDLAVGSGYPDMLFYRFKPDGIRYSADGWPVNMTVHKTAVCGGQLWGLGESVRNMPAVIMAQDQKILSGGDHYLRGIASDGRGGWYIAGSAGLKRYTEASPKKALRRIGGIEKLAALAADKGVIVAVPEKSLRMIALNADDLPDSPLLSPGDYSWQFLYGSTWNGHISGLLKDGNTYLVLNGKMGVLCRFDPDVPMSQRTKRWSVIQMEPAVKDSLSMAKAGERIYILTASGLLAGKDAVPLKLVPVPLPLPANCMKIVGMPDGSLLAAGRNELVLLKDGKQSWKTAVPEGITDIAAGGEYVAAGSPSGIQLYTLADGKSAGTFSKKGFHPGQIALDGNWLFAEDPANFRILRFKIK